MTGSRDARAVGRAAGWRWLVVPPALLIAWLGPRPSSAPAAPAQARPNVILIITDDQGYGDFGVTGNPIVKTPHLDTMARRSAQMTTFYVSPVCSPTRACLMTGRYNFRTRCIDTYVGRSMMDPDEMTMAELLRGAGYATGIFGKWHLGDNYPLRAMDQGFAESLVHRGGGIGQPSDPPGGEGRYTNPILLHNGQLTPMTGYCTDIYFDAALKWIERCQQRQQNFFVYLATNAPHGPFDDVPAAWLQVYQRQNLANDQFPQSPGHAVPGQADTERRARIFAMISNIDDNIGRLFSRLDQLGLRENTLVMFLVDNGPQGPRYVAGMRGMKTEVYEGGIRSPLFAHWPAMLPAGQASDRVAAHIDLLPTVLEACQVALPADRQLDGRSLLPLLRGAPAPWPDRTIFLQSHRGDRPARYHNFAARSQQWKLIHASGFEREQFEGTPRFELYDMAQDPLELEDLAAARPQIVAQMQQAYDAWFDDVSATRPDNYAPPRIHVGSQHEDPVVLTRQNWRHTQGRPWAANSNGHWQLLVVGHSRFDIRLRFPALTAAGTARLSVGGQVVTAELAPGAGEWTFQDLGLAPGQTQLCAELCCGGQSAGPWQVDVTRCPSTPP
ncbi:MAG: arylsulfatase [Planctomycetes bacterium RBG_16_64_10]|nr:MAG: arylsulfatase [Planctomycetes bacterium RBG_16_64_10]